MNNLEVVKKERNPFGPGFQDVIVVKSFDVVKNKLFTGSYAQRQGYTYITFALMGQKGISIRDIDGFSQNLIYWKNPFNAKQKLKNDYFLNRYVLPLEDSPEKEFILNFINN